MQRIEYAMFDAIYRDNKEKLQSLIAILPKNFDPTFLDDRTPGQYRYSGYGFLHAAIVTGKKAVPILEILLNIPGIDVNLGARTTRVTPLYLALLQLNYANEETLYTLIDKLTKVPSLNVNLKPPITNHGEFHHTPFEYAATKLSIKLVNLILNAKNFSLVGTNLPYALNEILLDTSMYTEADNFIAYNAIFPLLVQLGAGIGCSLSFSLLGFPKDTDTKNGIFIGTISDRNDNITRISRDTLGFQNAITNLDECKIALNSGLLDKQLKFLIQSCHLATQADTEYKEEIKEIGNLLKEYQLKLKTICLQFITFSNNPAVQNLTRLPKELSEEIIARKKMLT